MSLLLATKSILKWIITDLSAFGGKKIRQHPSKPCHPCANFFIPKELIVIFNASALDKDSKACYAGQREAAPS